MTIGIDVAEPTEPEPRPGTAFNDAFNVAAADPLKPTAVAVISPPEIEKFCDVCNTVALFALP